MATASSNRRSAPRMIGSLSSSPIQEPLAMPEPAPRRSRRKLWVGLGMLVGLVWLAPMIVARSPAIHWFALKSLGDLRGSVTIGSASLGWFSPIVLSNLKLHDERGQEVITIGEVRSERSLLGLVKAGSDLGNFKITSPVVQCTLRSDGSNLEDLLAPLLDRPESNSATSLTIEIVNGSVVVHDGASGPTSQLSNLQATIGMPAVGATCVQATANAQTGPHAGDVSVKVGPVDAATADSPVRIHVQSKSLGLALLQPLVRRFVDASLRLDGRLNCDVQIDLANSTAPLTVAGHVAAADLTVSAAWLEDTLRLSGLQTPLRIAYGDRLTIDDFDISCDIGRLAAKGVFPAEYASAADLWQALKQNAYQMQAQIDLPRLAALMPRTMRLRPGMQVTSGIVDLLASSMPDAAGQQWRATAEVRQLATVGQGRQRNWETPLALALHAHESAAGPVLDSLVCNSSFLKLQAVASRDDGEASASCDLDRLAVELAELVDLGDTRLGGQAVAQLKWNRRPADRVDGSGSIRLTKLQITRPDVRPWAEDDLYFFFNASTTTDGAAIRRVEMCNIDVTAGADKLTASLTAPVDLSQTANWPLQARLQGRLERWLPRVQPWLSLPGWTIEGDADLGLTALYHSEGVRIDAAQANLASLRVWGGGLFIDEPSMTMQTAGAWESAKERLVLNKTTLASSAVQLETDSVMLTLGASSPACDTTLRYQGDLARLARWVQDPRSPPSYLAVGRLQGTSRIGTRAGLISLQSENTVGEFALYDAVAPAGPTRTPVWSERQLSIAANADYDTVQDAVELRAAEVTAQSLRLQAAGKVSQMATRCDAALSGQLDYDLATITRLMQPSWGDGIKLTGRESRRFSVQGPLAGAANTAAMLANLTAETSLGWQSAEIYGLPIGQGQIAAKLGGGNLAVEPLDVRVGQEGRLIFAPEFRLSPEPALLTLPKGPLIQQVRVTPEVCATALKYLAPTLADSAQAEGLLSVELTGGQLPLASPATGDVAGRLTIHQVNVLPGATAKAMLLFGKQLEAIIKRQAPPIELEPNATLLKMGSQAVDFRLVQGRVYHQNLQMVLGDIAMRTTGSVGLDQSLSLVAEIPLTDDWVGRDPLLASFRGKTISVPIAGTLSKPRLDPRVLEQLTGQMLKQGAQDAIRDGLNKQIDQGLNRLFR